MYKDYIFADNKKPKKPTWKIALKVLKYLFYSFLFLSMLWGCSEMFVSKYGSFQVVDSAGKSVYKSGVFFEILFSGFFTNKIHYFHYHDGHIYEYPYLAINSWGQAFQETKSPFYGCFVYPTSWMLVHMIYAFGGVNSGGAILASIFIMSLFVRSITVGFTWKTQLNQDKMQVLQLKQSEIKAKYKDSRDPLIKRKQQMEIMALYRKEKISPLASIGTTFLSFPFLFALYITIKSTRVLKSSSIGEIDLIQKPSSMIFSGHVVYLALLLVYLPIQITSVFLPTFLNLRTQKFKTAEQKKARRKQFIMQGVFVLMFFFVAISVASGVAIYWIFSGFLQILQTLGFHYIKIWKRNSNKRHILKQKKLKLAEKKEIKKIESKSKILNSKKKSLNKKNNSKKNKKKKSTTFSI